jgi:Ca2+-binding EF-hand superfamily protein
MRILTGFVILELERLFLKYSNDDGMTIERSFVKNLVQLIGLNPSNRQINAALKSVENESLCFEDLKSIVSIFYEDNIEEELRAAFLKFDSDINGYLDEKEFESLMCSYGEKLSTDEFREMMKLVDGNNDGKIKYEGILCDLK